MAVPFTEKTGALIIHGARALIGDTDYTGYQVSQPRAHVLYLHTLQELAADIQLFSDAPSTIPMWVGEYSKIFSTNRVIASVGEAFWSHSGAPARRLKRIPPEEIQAMWRGDLDQTGQVRQGEIAYWSVQQDNLSVQNAPAACFYPAAGFAGNITLQVPSVAADHDLGVTLSIDMGLTQLLELMLACEFLGDLTPEALAKLGLGPQSVERMTMKCEKRKADERWRTGIGRRQSGVHMRSPN